jgi:putative ABC transport system permease protein
LTGGLIGLIIGVGVSYLVAVIAQAKGYSWDFIISIGSVIFAIGMSSLIGIVFGMYPARRAARLNPIEALRYE